RFVLHHNSYFIISSFWRAHMSTLYPYTTLFRSKCMDGAEIDTLIDERFVKMRNFIDQRFRDIPSIGWDANRLRACAHDAFNKLRSEEHTSELQSPYDLVCRLLLEKKKICRSSAR